jgi:purine-binding chemotaxis protein CheW
MVTGDIRPDAPGAAQLQAVVFGIGAQQYALPVELVREIVQVPALLELAGAAAVICGVLNRHGVYIPVLDGRAMVGQPPHATLDSMVVLAGVAQPEVALLVDGVAGVAQFAAEQCTSFDDQSVAPFLAGIASADSGPVLLLEFPALLAMIPALIRQVA